MNRYGKMGRNQPRSSDYWEWGLIEMNSYRSTTLLFLFMFIFDVSDGK